jgi:hypothetical protein
VVYAAENDSRAATRLEALCWDHAPAGFGDQVVFSETVIPKMCTVVEDPARIENEGLVPLFPGASRAILVEAFDQIMVESQAPLGLSGGCPPLSKNGSSTLLPRPSFWGITRFTPGWVPGGK